MSDFSMFDANGNPVGAPPAPPMGGPPLAPPPTSLLMDVPAGGPAFGASPLERSLGATVQGFAPSGPVVPAPAPAGPAAPPVTRLADLQRAAPPSADAGPRADMPGGVANMGTASEGMMALLRQQAAEELAKGRGGYYKGRPESRQDTGGQRQRSMGEAPELTQRQRDLWSGPQPLQRVEAPTLAYTPLDVLSLSQPPPDAKTPKQKMEWAAREAQDWTKAGVSVEVLEQTGKIAAPEWRPKNWASLTGEQQDALEAEHAKDPAMDKRRGLMRMIDARHSQALDRVGAANEAARAEYDRDVERYGAEGIAGEVTTQARAAARAEDAAVGVAERRGAADAAFLEKKAELLRSAEDRGKDLMDRINSTVADVQSQKIDPGAFWNSRTTGQKFALAIATGMGAFAQAMGQGPNTAEQIISKAADDDIKAQIANIDKKKGDLTELQKLYKATLDQTGDKIAAEDAMRLAAHASIDSQLAEAQQTAKSEIAASRVKELRGKFELQRIEREAALSERMRGTEGVNFRVNPAVAAGYGGGTSLEKLKQIQREMIATSHGQATVDLAAGAAAAKGQEKPAERAVLGGQTYALQNVSSPAEGAKMREKMASLSNMDKWLDVVDKARTQYASNVISKAQLDNAVARYASALSAAEGQGIVKKEEMELIRDSMTSLAKGGDVVKDLRANHRNLREDLLTQSGAVPVGKR